jgi:hypothetical protein
MGFIFNEDRGKVPVTATAAGAITVAAGTDYSAAKIRNIILSTEEPTSEDGSNGDIWIIYES